MSVDQIEEQIRQLSISELGKLTKWLTEYLASHTSSEVEAWQESAEQVAELETRLAQFLNDPSIAIPFEDAYFDKLKHKLADERSQKPSACEGRH